MILAQAMDAIRCGLEYMQSCFEVRLIWLLLLFLPVFISFGLPILLQVLYFYGCALFLHVYKLRGNINEAYTHRRWDGARNILASLSNAQGWLWHGYEIVGFENIPAEGPALIIYYHGGLPIDIYYLQAQCILYKRRPLCLVADNFLFKIPGWKLLMGVSYVWAGSIRSCVEKLKKGNLLCISPGGTREALFSSQDYELLWGNRIGFAKVALIANVPVIPVFTENCREALRTPELCRKVCRNLYEKTKLPVVPVYGGFPVKLRTYIGSPIYPKPGIDAETFRDEVKVAVETLIAQHQRLPGQIIPALLDRLPWSRFQASKSGE